MSMKCARFEKAGGNLELADVPIPSIKPGHVKIKVYACGVCHSDLFTKAGTMPGAVFPRIPGHEVVGRVAEVASDVSKFKVGDKVGVGWFGGHCGTCKPCLENDWVCCTTMKVCGIAYDGGYAEYMVAPQDAIARMPENLKFKYAGPLMCAGITVYNSIRRQNILSGSVVAVTGLGGLGHLAIQFCRKLGFETVAYSSGSDKKKLALELGAHHYIDGSQPDAVQQLANLSPKMIVVTAPSAKAVESIIPALATGGKIVIVGAISEPVNVNTTILLMKKQSIVGWPSGDSRDSEDTLVFSANNGVQPMVEVFPLERANDAINKMLDNTIRFRGVLALVPVEKLEE